MSDIAEVARAKVNLALHVTGRREDGYHLLDSLVVFPAVGDLVEVEPATRTSLTVKGAFSDQLPADGENLVLKAAALMPDTPASIRLTKSLPLAAGIGGGSADAAATLRALARLGGTKLPDPARILALGADVPVCLEERSVRMTGIGEVIEGIPDLPDFWLVLANPGVACPTGPVFRGLVRVNNPPMPPMPKAFSDLIDFADWLGATVNDLEAPAFELCPPAKDARDALASQSGCHLARMSGSGATAFGIFGDEASALAAAEAIRASAPNWWVVAAPV